MSENKFFVSMHRCLTAFLLSIAVFAHMSCTSDDDEKYVNAIWPNMTQEYYGQHLSDLEVHDTLDDMLPDELRILSKKGAQEGSGVFKRKRIRIKGVGAVTDVAHSLQENESIIIAGDRKAVKFSRGFKGERSIMADFGPYAVSSEGRTIKVAQCQDEIRFINMGSWFEPVICYSENGLELWRQKVPSGVNDATLIMGMGNRQESIAIGYNGDEGLQIIDMQGKVVQSLSDELIFDVEQRRGTGASSSATLGYVSAEPGIMIWDGETTIAISSSTYSDLTGFTLLEEPLTGNAEGIAVPRRNYIDLFDINGRYVSSVQTPIDTLWASMSTYVFRPVRDKPALLVALLTYEMQECAMLLVYDSNGNLLYWENFSNARYHGPFPVTVNEKECFAVGAIETIYLYALK